jgi:hypothetical protein
VDVIRHSKIINEQNDFAPNERTRHQSPEGSNYRVTAMDPAETDALERMKKSAGISAFITSELSDDEPLES